MKHTPKNDARTASRTSKSGSSWWLAAAIAATSFSTTNANVDIANVPLFLTASVPPLAMINMSNDNQLYFSAYPDYADLTGDGAPDLTYTHDFDYFGYFDSYKCYTYSSNYFQPSTTTNDKYCSGTQWSGNFLNWVSMARIDIVRKILYGGYRSTDDSNQTILERTYLPNDAHSWVRYYDGDDLPNLTPFELPESTSTTSNTEVTVPNGTRNDDASEIEIATGWRSTSDVEIGDQVMVRSTTSSDTIWMAGVATDFDPDDGELQIQVTGSGSPGVTRSSWSILNPSRRGVSFCNTTSTSTDRSQGVNTDNDPPLIRVASGNYSLWTANERWQCQWAEEEQRTGHSDMRIAGTSFSNGNDVISSGIPANADNPARARVGLGDLDYSARAEVCVDGLLGTENCKQYPNGGSKPVGLLHQFGEDGSIHFGLLTGTYSRNLSGGTLRKNIESFEDEVDSDTGEFTPDRNGGPIVSSLNAFRLYGYDHGDGLYSGAGDDCGVGVQRTQMQDGRCMSWGNPQSEMFLESLRYFGGLDRTSGFHVSGTDQIDNLTSEDWNDPLDDENWCAALSLINFNASFNSFDGDELGGFSALPGSGSLDAWTNEVGAEEVNTGSVFYGGSNALCTAKSLTSLSSLTGLCPEAPNQSGTYDIAGLANYAWNESIRTDLTDSDGQTADINLKTYGVSLAPAVPRIEIPRPGEDTASVTILPACENLGDGGLRCALADFRVVEQDIEAGTGSFFIQWDVHEWGSDFDMDINGTLSYQITGSNIAVTTDTWSQSSSRDTGFGYITSGTTRDGFHAHSGINGYNYNDPTGATGCNNCRLSDEPTTETYSLGGAPAQLLDDPVLYAAKWGGYDKELDAELKADGESGFPDNPDTWDKDGSGLPDNYFFAIDPAELFDGLESALEDIVARAEDSASAAAVSSATLRADTLLFSGGFRSTDWSGFFQAFELDQVTGSVTGVAWDVEEQLRNAEPTGRNLVTSNTDSGDGVPLELGELSDEQQEALNRDLDGEEDDLATARIEWLWGWERDALRSREAGGELRLLGDTINADPQFMGKEDFGYRLLPGQEGEAYTAFRQESSYQERPDVMFVAANDGLLHAFDAETGEELFGYLPGELLQARENESWAVINELMFKDYSHRYFHDGTPTVADAYWDSSWKTVLVGAMGAGGRTVYALDVTNPENFNENRVLWEFTDEDLGFGVKEPQIVRMANGEWAVVFGNGYGSDNDEAVLFIVRVSDGQLIEKIKTGAGSSANPSGLGPVVTTDWPGQSLVTSRIYAADLQGNVWRFDVTGSNTGGWSAESLFQAMDSDGDPQPITVRPRLAADPESSEALMVLFGTGSYFRTQDGNMDNPQTQSLYGIRDTANGQEVQRADLLEQEIVWQGDAIFDGETSTLREVSDNTRDNTHEGWVMDLTWDSSTAGERVVSAASFPAGSDRERVRFSTLIPEEAPCSTGRTGFLMDLRLADGAQYSESVFDLNQDGVFDQDDEVQDKLISGVQSGGGQTHVGVVASDGDTEFLYDGGEDDETNKDPERGRTSGFDPGRHSWQQIR